MATTINPSEISELIRSRIEQFKLSAEARNEGLGQTVIASLLRSMRARMSTGPLHEGQARPGTRVTVIFPRRGMPEADAAD